MATKKDTKKKPTKAASKTSRKKLPSFFSLTNKRFVVLLVIFLTAAGTGSYYVYTSQAASDGIKTFPSVAQCYRYKPYLYKGVQNQFECTKTVQRFFNTYLTSDNYYKKPAIVVDGKFGPATEQAVKDFQSYINTRPTNHLVVDGKIGPLTWDEIAKFCYVWGESTSREFHNVCYE